MASKFALIIANTEYQDASFAKLTAPGKDAEEFAHVLREPDLGAFDDVQVLLNEEESKIRRAIARFFVNRSRDDLLLLYFSGHGVRNGQGQLFLAANDTERSILDATGIPADFITQAMNNSRSQRQLLILDCCNSGAFAHGSKSAAVIGKSMGIATAFEGSGFGRVVLTASDATQYAWEGDKVIGDTQKSVFTHFLVEGLKGEADYDGDGRIHVDELYDYAYEQVVRRTPKQTPGKWSYKQQGDIVLRENLKARDVKPAPLPSELLEVLSHPNSGVRKAGIHELIAMLDGQHLRLARAAEEKLREIAENDDSLTLRKTASDTLTSRGITGELSLPVEIAKQSPSVEIPGPAEITKRDPREEQKIDIAARISPLPIEEARQRIEPFEAVNEKTPHNFPEKSSLSGKLHLRMIGGVAGLILTIALFAWVGSIIQNNFSNQQSQQTAYSAATVRLAQTTIAGTQASQASLTAAAATPILSTPTIPPLGIGSTMISEKDGMILVYVPAGEFTMGTEGGKPEEGPVHKVNLDDFWIDQTEVTNTMYTKCVQDGDCTEPTDLTYHSDSNYADHPVLAVSWEQAIEYCSWAGRRLPTEAEWEKAARGTDARTYPWGEGIGCSKANYDTNCIRDTTQVGSYESGQSPYGVYDMAGNVAEWVSSLYKPYPYSATDGREDLSTLSERVVRGGSWNDPDDYDRSTNRVWYIPPISFTDVGFRCAISASP